ncbi:DnaD domain-containing protein [Camelliibacillus cellulosilyticus]|uniref:DnaD domain-containing protein n=1 Tax=Camelliibacillus cellulosilyticus TaxID=2174486 RepID=A0ABV9GKV9_9BACL
MEKQVMIDFMTNSGLTIPRFLLENYVDIGLNEEECLLLLHVYSFLKGGHNFPTPDELSSRMSLTSAQCADHLRRLVQRGFLDIVHEKNQAIYTESYSLEPLWNKLVSLKLLSLKDDAALEQEEALYTIFEKEFGRPLSPIECETLTMWLDEDRHTPELIKGALREAVISGKLNFRYIDRILFDWKKNGIKTLEQAKAHGEKIRGRMQVNGERSDQSRKKPLKFPMYNWLES